MRNEFNKHNHNIININCSIIQFKTPSLEIRGTNVSSKEFLLEKTSLIELSVSVQDYLAKFLMLLVFLLTHMVHSFSKIT